MTKRQYVGPVDAVVTLIGGVERYVERGDVVEVTPAEAKLLDAQSGNWTVPRKGGDE